MGKSKFILSQSFIDLSFRYVLTPLMICFVLYLVFTFLSASLLIIVVILLVIVILTVISYGFNISRIEIEDSNIKCFTLFKVYSYNLKNIVSMSLVRTVFDMGFNYQIRVKERTITFGVPLNWKEFEGFLITRADLELENTSILVVAGDYPTARRWKKRGMEYVNTGIADSFMGLNYLGGRGAKWKFLFVLTIFIIFVIFVIYVKVLTPSKPIEVKQNIEVKTVDGCNNDTECSTNEFCDISRPGGMTPSGYESGEPYGSRKCISICKSNSDCSSNQCKNYMIVGGDLVINKKGCTSE